MSALFFLVQCAVGVLRPIKNALALDGLGGTNFYRVYLVSAAVVLFVPLYARLVERVSWRRLVPAIALFFAFNLLLLRIMYRPGSPVFGLVFYGWYDLFSAGLITQFFIAAQQFVDARSAKRAYPLVIAGGSIGAAAGGAITGFFAEAIGTPNLLLVAAVLIVTFGLALPAVGGPARVARPKKPPVSDTMTLSGFRQVIRDPHVRLIAIMVLVTILVKQLVDYQFNLLTKEVYVTRDAISAFQGQFNLATQWLPLVVLAALRPILRRYGVGVAVLMLPVGMLLGNVTLAIAWSLWAGVFAKATETTFRYSAERAGREILYVPVPDDLKLKAKTYIDVALEEGLGKAAAAGLIFVLLLVVDQRQIAMVGALLSLIWLILGLAVRRQYVQTLAQSIEGRFASIRGLHGSLADATTWPLIRRALTSQDPLQAAFALDFLEQSRPDDVRALAPDLQALLEHPSAEIRGRALSLLERFPEAADPAALRGRLTDPAASVREAAVRAYCAALDGRTLEELLSSEWAVVRTATLACIARGEIDGLEAVRQRYRLDEWQHAGTPAARQELALAVSTMAGDPEAERLVERLLDDPDSEVASTALLAAARLGLRRSYSKLIDALGSPGTREAARTALATLGPEAVGPLARRLLDPAADPVIRRAVPSVLARIPCEATVEALLHSVIAPETEQLLDYRTIKALNKLRARHPDLTFDARPVLEIVRREVQAARRYAAGHAILARTGGDPVIGLARQALTDAWLYRREGAFRCLGLLHAPDEVYRCYIAITGATPAARANAIEWLEQTVGYSLFHELEPILVRDIGEGGTRSAPAALADLTEDADTWAAACATAAARSLGVEAPAPARENAGMDLIETVFLLQRVDLLKDARSGHLALLATIAEEVAVERDVVLIREGESTEALYVVVRGAVELRGVGGQLTIGEGGAFGTWALIDEAPSPVEARTRESTRMLQIRREEFHDLVADHPELAIGLLQGLARRIRTLVA